MRHKAQVSHFGRRNDQRRALLRGLVNSLVEYGRIKTTFAKAKELRRHAERAVTIGRQGTLHARRILLARYPNKKVIDILMSDIAPRYKTTPGGYTRIIKIGRRPGDSAEMAYIEWVHYEPEAKEESGDTKKKTGKAASAAKTAKKTKGAKSKKSDTKKADAKSDVGQEGQEKKKTAKKNTKKTE